MLQTLIVLVLAVVLGFALGRGLRVWLDAGRFGWPPARRLGWSFAGAVAPSRYWWGARVDALPGPERAALLAYETRVLGLEHAANLCCPLCGAEIQGAWTLDSGGEVTAAAGPVECPRCDFRLDACRHCVHFLAGAPQSWHSGAVHRGGDLWNQPDGTWGRCGHYKRSQPVEDAVAPDMARTLKRQGYEEIRAPMRIADSMLRLDFCRAFALDPKRLQQASRVRRPGRKRAALLRILLLRDGEEGQSPLSVQAKTEPTGAETFNGAGADPE